MFRPLVALFRPLKYIKIKITIPTSIWVTWLITLLGWGGGGQNPPWVLGTLIYEGVKIERG
jgi:hypothetical protein